MLRYRYLTGTPLTSEVQTRRKGETSEFLNPGITHNHDSCPEVYTNPDICTFKHTLEHLIRPKSPILLFPGITILGL